MVEAMAPPTPSVRVGLRRSILANQMLLAVAAFIGVVVSILVDQVTDATPFFVGAALLFAGAVAAVLLPWDLLPGGARPCCRSSTWWRSP